MHLLKQEHISSGPDPSLVACVGIQTCPKMGAQSRAEYFIALFTLCTPCTGTCSQEVSDHNAGSVWARFSGHVIFSDVAQERELCPLVLFKSWSWPTEIVSSYKWKVLRVCTVTRGRLCTAPVLCPGGDLECQLL